MTYEEIFNKSKELILANETDGLEGHIAVQVNIIEEGEGIFYIELKDGKVYVEPYEYYDRDCIFIVTGKNFIKMCEGTLNPVAAFTTGKLKVEGSIEKALEFQKLVNKVQKKTTKQAKGK